MMVEYYNPNTTATQTDMARTGQGLKENEEPKNENGGYDEMKTIVETYTSETTVQKQETEFTESMLLSELKSGDPVIYLSTREKDGEWEGGHFNIIYGYYWDSSNNRNIYLTYDPWIPAQGQTRFIWMYGVEAGLIYSMKWTRQQQQIGRLMMITILMLIIMLTGLCTVSSR